ncbi:MAG: peptidase MA family metallohydrolase [bacterium]
MDSKLRFLRTLIGLVVLLFIVSGVPAQAQDDRMVQPDVAERINRAWKAYRQQQPNKAMRLIRPLTTRGDLPPDVYLLAGKIFYDKNRFNRAIGQFQSSYRKTNNPELRETAQKLIQRSKKLYDLNLRSNIYSHFIILTAPGIPSGVSGNLNHDLAKAYRRIGGDLDLFPENKFTVILYEQPQFRRVIQAPVWSGGVFDGKIHLPYRSESSQPYTTRSLYHEYTHALLYHIARNNLPLWFNEGFATFQEYRQSRDRFKYRQLKQNRPEKNISSLSDISEIFKQKTDREKARLAYEYSYSLIDFLEDRYGLILIKRIIQRTGEEGSFKKAAESILNRSLNSLQFEWENWLERELR